ncbi:hypothetical protein [Brucella anthropi]|uniref:hypothetical protein n=1 Tax=Brucella anthropi TaxID=529 RepID=UPI001F3B49EC|nr:hypothetical protein [Brucella anthropi]
MTYTIKYSFDKTTSKDTPIGTAVSKSSDYAIHVTASISDGTSDPVKGKILQFYTDPPTLIVMDSKGKSLEYDNVWGSYLISDEEGEYSFYLAAQQKTIVKTGLIVEDDPDSANDLDPPIVVFSSYVGLTTKYGPPVVHDDDGVIDLGSGTPYINIGLPSTTKDFTNFPEAMTALLVNGSQSVTGLFSTIFNDGFTVPTNMLLTEEPNQFGYIIVNGTSSAAPVTAWTKVTGAILTKPLPSPLRTLTQSPYLPAHAATVNDASKDLPVYIDIPEGNPDNIAKDDVIDLTVYINSYNQGTNQPNNKIISLAQIVVNDNDITSKNITSKINGSDLQGCGMNASAVPGTIYIDYTLKKAKSDTVSAMPQQYYSGLINTVGPI